jgi:hypothetical protein
VSFLASQWANFHSAPYGLPSPRLGGSTSPRTGAVSFDEAREAPDRTASILGSLKQDETLDANTPPGRIGLIQRRSSTPTEAMSGVKA